MSALAGDAADDEADAGDPDNAHNIARCRPLRTEDQPHQWIGNKRYAEACRNRDHRSAGHDAEIDFADAEAGMAGCRKTWVSRPSERPG